MAIGRIKIGVLPPEILGTTIITVPLGSTVTITKANLMSSILPYYQEQNYPIGSVKIVGHNNSFQLLLSQTTVVSTTIAVLTNNSNRIYKTSSTSTISNATITSANMVSNFKVQGVKLGSSYINYTATAINPSNTESEFSTIQGKIIINVVPVVNNPPSNIDDFEVDCPYLGSVSIDAEAFTQGYADPEGDPQKEVRFDVITPNGILLLNGIPLTTNGYITTLENLQQSSMIYISNSSTPNGSIQEIQFSVSDFGSGQFTS